jgi:hypothetical protein
MDLGSQEVANLISYAALIVSGVLAFFYIRDRRHTRFRIAQEYVDKLLAWHGAVVDVLMRLEAIGDGDEDKRELLARLSSLIEQGRFYFPNLVRGDFGQDKPPAYRGHRNIALDFLVALHRTHKRPRSAYDEERVQYLRQLFTSVVFELVNPSRQLKIVKSLTDRYFTPDYSLDDLDRISDLKKIAALDALWATDVERSGADGPQRD